MLNEVQGHPNTSQSAALILDPAMIEIGDNNISKKQPEIVPDGVTRRSLLDAGRRRHKRLRGRH